MPYYTKLDLQVLDEMTEEQHNKVRNLLFLYYKDLVEDGNCDPDTLKGLHVVCQAIGAFKE